jgi:hypothetical protein
MFGMARLNSLAAISATAPPAPTSTQDITAVTAQPLGGPFTNGGFNTSTGSTNNNGSRRFDRPTGDTTSKLGGGTGGTLDFWIYYANGGSTPSGATSFLANDVVEYNQQRSFMLWRQTYNNQFGWADSGGVELRNIGNLTSATWYHVALQTTGNNTWNTWLDGVSKSSFTNSASFSSIHIGAAGIQNNSWPHRARFSNIRWSTSQRYTAGSNFTRPAASYTWDSNTFMLFRGNDNNPLTA